MTTEREVFHHELFQEIQLFADSAGQFAEDAFFDIVCPYLIDAGELITADRAHHVSRGMRVDGYGGSPADSDGALNLIVADFHQADEVATLTRTDMDAIFRRLTSFLTRVADADFRNSLEESSPAFGLADFITSVWPSVLKVRMTLITNKILSSRVDGREAGEFGSVPVTYSVWDLSRLQRYASSGSEREDIEIDLSDFEGHIPALSAHMPDATYESYLATISGTQLAAIYDRWGVRLLEQNVRVFLQARGNVNRGIRNTLENYPEMFFAYNNGITATAEELETRNTDDGLEIVRIKNFQIVNGGQTTASIHAASKRDKVDISSVFVQMKLSVVEQDLADVIVPRISEYANSQNRVNAADFFANHPYHQRMEQFSRRIYAPSPDGAFRESKWFYERARGQYQDARSGKSAAERAKFDLEYPKRQLFAKTDLAKFVNVWDDQPDIVSKGAQKNFAQFAKIIGREWDRNSNAINEMYYRDTIAKAIVFRQVEKLVSAQPWYEGGYRANIVAYTIAKLAWDVSESGNEVDFDAVWRSQDLTAELRESLTFGAKIVHDVLVNPPAGVRNVSEWAKQPAAWDRVKQVDIKWPTSLQQSLVGAQQQKQKVRDAKKDQKVLNGIEAQMAVVNAGNQFWEELKTWGIEKKVLSPADLGVLGVAAAVPTHIPSELQSQKVMEALKKLQGHGCPMVLPVD